MASSASGSASAAVPPSSSSSSSAAAAGGGGGGGGAGGGAAAFAFEVVEREVKASSAAFLVDLTPDVRERASRLSLLLPPRVVLEDAGLGLTNKEKEVSVGFLIHTFPFPPVCSQSL